MVINLPDSSEPGAIVDPDGRNIAEIRDPDGNTVWEAVQMIDGFEDGDISEYYSDTSWFAVQTNTVLDGSYALEGPGPGGSEPKRIGASEASGLSATPSSGDKYEFYFTADSRTDAGLGPFIYERVQDPTQPRQSNYQWRFQYDANWPIYHTRNDNGSSTQLYNWQDIDVTFSTTPEWNRIVFDTYEDSNAYYWDMEVYTGVTEVGGGTLIDSRTFEDTNKSAGYSSGGWGWYVPYDSYTSIYYDHAQIL